MSLFTVIYKDKTIFKGGDLLNPEWLAISKPIHSIFYSLPSGDSLCLANFKRIYHFVEGCKDLMGKEKGKLQIEFSHLILERNNKFLHYKIDQKNNNVIFEELNSDSKILKELNSLGWKNGAN